MSTPSEPRQPHDGPVIEPIRVLRPRRTDALAELMREYRQQSGGHEAVAVPVPPPGSEERTQEIPPVTTGGGRRPRGRGSGPAVRRTAVVVAVAAAAAIGFGSAFLLPGANTDDSAAPAPQPSATAPSPTPTPTPTPPPPATAPVDPDGPGTLREGAGGPEVTELQERLLRIPNVYQDGSTSGRYDATLTAAVARFQVWYGVRGDENGVYGNDTRLALESRTAPGAG